MAGPQQTVHITKAAVENAPKRPDLSTPEAAVRSYLDWTTYAYRVGQSSVATPTMTSKEFIRVDAYSQYNIEQKRLVDLKLDSITFGQPRSLSATKTVLSAVEQWTYSYLCIAEGNKKIGGPYDLGYTTEYSVVKNKRGEWVVDSVKATPKGKVK